MRKCETCSEVKEKGYANLTGKFVCERCYDSNEKYLVNRINISANAIEEKAPFEEDVGRDNFIIYCTDLFEGLAKRAYVQMKQMKEKNEDWTWLGMARAIEYFYIVRKNDIKKAKKGIGIIPYVYDDAQKFYKNFNYKNYQKALDLKKAMKKAKEEKEVIYSVKSSKKVDQIDISEL